MDLHAMTEARGPALDLALAEHERVEWRMDLIAAMLDRKVQPILDRIKELERAVEVLSQPRGPVKMRGCTTEGCKRQGYARGLCAMHYNRVMRAERQRRWEGLESLVGVRAA